MNSNVWISISLIFVGLSILIGADKIGRSRYEIVASINPQIEEPYIKFDRWTGAAFVCSASTETCIDISNRTKFLLSSEINDSISKSTDEKRKKLEEIKKHTP